ncbi:MAG: hypothetical protein AVDCRST_MAG60-680 [uncultured Nocardioides sp.]|uniref:WD40 repeat domain-containing protein n=1 Tax=uncultured Nocardioides sp. TaxID=198441 RepID=A0A6J4N5W8_9ACTN|nr:MAG: hypothetical protein AVDCRST_MAG60-680 [uncultured Nocardioides sp.]
MTERLLRGLGLLAVVTPFVVGLTAAGADRDGREVLRFQDPEIVESSGLVVEGDLLHTTNDSGDTGRVFTVDLGTGETVGETFWADGPDDVEALAPAGRGHVWVADIGDNTASRDSISVTRVPVGTGTRTVAEEAFDLVYPDGQRDAEALLVHPVTGRVYVATKGVFAGELYAAPPDLADDAPNMLGLLGTTTGIVTDGAFLPDGEHLVLRTYTTAVLYTFPALEQVAAFDLPSQQQGEGIAAPSTDVVFLSSEGQRAPVLGVPLPRDVRTLLAPTPSGSVAQSTAPAAAATAPTASDAAAPATGAGTSADTAPTVDGRAWGWAIGAVVSIGAVVVLLRALKPR